MRREQVPLPKWSNSLLATIGNIQVNFSIVFEAKFGQPTQAESPALSHKGSSISYFLRSGESCLGSNCGPIHFRRRQKITNRVRLCGGIQTRICDVRGIGVGNLGAFHQ